MSLPRVINIDGVTYARVDSIRKDELEPREWSKAVIAAAARASFVRPKEITGRARGPRLSKIRAAVISVMRDEGNMTWEDIGVRLGGRNHGTVWTCHKEHAKSAQSKRLRKEIVERLQLDLDGGKEE